MPRVDNQDKRLGGSKKKRPSSRTLIRWDDDKDKQVLLMLQYVCNNEGIRIPWDKVAAGLGPDYSEGAIVQHLAKLRARMAEMGLGVPPPLKRGVLQTPSKVYALGSRTLRGLPPRLITPPTQRSPSIITTSAKKATARSKARKAKDIYDDDVTMDEMSDDTPKGTSSASKGRKKEVKSEEADSVQVKEEYAPRRSSARTAGVRKDYTKMVDDESEDEEFGEPSEPSGGEADHTPAESTEKQVEEVMEQSNGKEEDCDEDEEENNEIKSEHVFSQTLSPGTGTRPTKVVKLPIPKVVSPDMSHTIASEGDAGFTSMPFTQGSPLLTAPYTLPNNTLGMSFNLGNIGFPGAITQFAHRHDFSTPFDRGLNHDPEYFGFDGGNQLPNFMASPSQVSSETRHAAHGLTVNPAALPRPYGSFSTDATTSSLDTAAAPSNKGDDSLPGNMSGLQFNFNELPNFDRDELEKFIHNDSMGDEDSHDVV